MFVPLKSPKSNEKRLENPSKVPAKTSTPRIHLFERRLHSKLTLGSLGELRRGFIMS